MQTLKAEIKAFLTSRRARLTPGQVGLALDGTARRVPGLRREEVAELAGISVEYYVILERGDLSTASEQVLAGIAGALRFDEAERIYLHNLARASRGTESFPATAHPASHVTGRIQGILDGFTLGPAWVRNEYMDILATNRSARALYAPIYRALPTRPNTARHVFLAEDARFFWVDADYYADAFAAKLRLESAAQPRDPRLESLVGELTEKSGAFRSRWASAKVSLLTNGIKRFHHPEAGRLDLHFETMELQSAPGLIMSFYLPTDAATTRGLAVLRQQG
jgi:transcriptional regulator with XRE-family HTH domain